jgi:hypothetical protein
MTAFLRNMLIIIILHMSDVIQKSVVLIAHLLHCSKIVLIPLDSAIPFYKKLGFEEAADGIHMYLTAEKIQKITSLTKVA